jgi:hypothetical protein
MISIAYIFIASLIVLFINLGYYKISNLGFYCNDESIKCGIKCVNVHFKSVDTIYDGISKFICPFLHTDGFVCRDRCIIGNVIFTNEITDFRLLIVTTIFLLLFSVVIIYYEYKHDLI